MITAFREVVMAQLFRLMSAILVLSVAATSAFAKGPFGSIHVGDWTGGAYTNDETGAFSHCAAGGQYRDGTYLVLSHNIDSSWSIGFANQSWNMAIQETLPIGVTFDGRAQARLFARVITAQSMVAILPNPVLQNLRKSQLMVAEVNGQTIQFQLPRIDQLIPTIANCVTKIKASGLAAAGDFSTPAPAASKPVAQQTPETSPPSKPAKLINQTGTGFVISSNGHIVTNNHVIDGCVGDIQGNLTGESASTLRIVSADELNDLALLQISKTFAEPAKIRASAIHPGDAVIAIGYPFHGLLTSDFTVTAGIVSSLSGLLNDTRYLQISAGVQSGNSGGPLLDTSGNVVGVVAAKINAIRFAKATGDLPENINFAIKTGAVRDFLDNSAVSYQTADSGQERKTADIAAKARAYTMLISCSAKDKAK